MGYLELEKVAHQKLKAAVVCDGHHDDGSPGTREPTKISIITHGNQGSIKIPATKMTKPCT